MFLFPTQNAGTGPHLVAAAAAHDEAAAGAAETEATDRVHLNRTAAAAEAEDQTPESDDRDGSEGGAIPGARAEE